MPNSPRDRINRKGCFVMLVILAVFGLLYLLVSLNSMPANRVESNIQTLPAPGH